MAESNSSDKPTIGELMNSLYDVQALINCAATTLDDDDDIDAIRVLRKATALTIQVINHLDAMELLPKEVLDIAEQVRTENPTKH